jgi:arsenate reductase
MAPSVLNPLTVAVMREKGIDVSGQHSKAFDWDMARQMDVVVTVCGHANETCPVLPPEVKRLHWPLEDPPAFSGNEAEVLTKFREIRDQIECRVRDLIQALKPTDQSGC